MADSPVSGGAPAPQQLPISQMRPGGNGMSPGLPTPAPQQPAPKPQPAPKADPAPATTAQERLGQVAEATLGKQDPAKTDTGTEDTAPVDEPIDPESLLLPDDEPADTVDPSEHAKKYQELLDSPDLSAEFLDKFVEVKVGKHVKPIKVSELVRDHQSKKESQRVINEAHAIRTQAEAATASYDRHFESVRKSPEDFIEVYERNGFDLEGVAKIIAKRVAGRNQMVRAMGAQVINELHGDVNNEMHWQDPRVVAAMKQAEQQYESQRQLDIRSREQQARIRELEAAQARAVEKQQDSAFVDESKAALAQLMPIAFKAHRLADNPINRQRFNQLVQQLVRAEGQSYNPADNGGKPWFPKITRQHCLDAAEIRRQEIEEERQSVVPPSRAPASPARGTGGGGVRQPAASAVEPMSISQMSRGIRR